MSFGPAAQEAEKILDRFGYIPVLGAELEWYIRPVGTTTPPLPGTADPAAYLAALEVACAQAGLALCSLDIERGPAQVEVGLLPTQDIEALLEALAEIRRLAPDVAATMGLEADFTAKPYRNTYGSALHVHVHLEGEGGYNVFQKSDEEISPQLAIGLMGLLATMREYMPVFAPTAASRQRFVPNFHAPVSVSWGVNNRTTALRLPDAASNLAGAEALARVPRSFARRIEHRVAGSDADPAQVVAAILSGICRGFAEPLALTEPIWGNAGDAQYAGRCEPL